jgi:hypothetical protein
MMLQRPGLGIAPLECAGGTSLWCGPQTDCSSATNWALAPACWSMSPSAWKQSEALTGGAAIPPPPPAVDMGTSTLPAPYACQADATSSPSCPGYTAAINASIAQQTAANQAAQQVAMNQVAANVKAQTQAGCPDLALIQNADGTWSCPQTPSTGGMSLTTIALLAAGGLVVGMYLMGRR